MVNACLAPVYCAFGLSLGPFRLVPPLVRRAGVFEEGK
jgi:hypothetical protein